MSLGDGDPSMAPGYRSHSSRSILSPREGNVPWSACDPLTKPPNEVVNCPPPNAARYKFPSKDPERRGNARGLKTHHLVSIDVFCRTSPSPGHRPIVFLLCAPRPHLSPDHMFWPHALGPPLASLLSADPMRAAAGRSHRWTRWGSGLADTSSPSQDGSTSQSHIRRISDSSTS